ncbi:MAG: hypothetical protein Kow0037_22810 [Calditrichia bacterium]
MSSANKPIHHIVAIIGAGVAGAEAAFQFARQGITAVVFERKTLPYGKIEEGLPKWHTSLRNQEEEKIDRKLTHPNVLFVPLAGLGERFSLNELIEDGYSAVVLATGAWKDRPLPIPGIDKFEGKGLYYQNPFVEWFNHNHEPGADSGGKEVKDGAVVVGGGLASLDVAKIIMLELFQKALEKRGIYRDVISLEKAGIDEVLRELKLDWDELGIKGCTLYYRKTVRDMPLSPIPDAANAERREKIRDIRARILKNYQTKFLFEVVDCAQPVDFLEENSRLVGLVFAKTYQNDSGRWRISDEKFEVPASMVVSSIGSIPVPIPGLPMKGERIALADEEMGMVEGFANVFAIGNAVTGRGNIRESMAHGRQISRQVAEALALEEEEITEQWFAAQEEASGQQAQQIEQWIREQALPTRQVYERILRKVEVYRKLAGYDGDYAGWVQRHKPPRLEEL